LDILRHVRRHATTSIRALAKALKRDYSNVHADVQALVSVGLLDVSKAGVSVEYDAINTKIAMRDEDSFDGAMPRPQWSPSTRKRS